MGTSTHLEITWPLNSEFIQAELEKLPPDRWGETWWKLTGEKASVRAVMHSLATTGKLPPGFPIQGALPMLRQ